MKKTHIKAIVVSAALVLFIGFGLAVYAGFKIISVAANAISPEVKNLSAISLVELEGLKGRFNPTGCMIGVNGLLNLSAWQTASLEENVKNLKTACFLPPKEKSDPVI